MAFLEDIKTKVDEYGLVIICVGGDYAYTVGMAKVGLPDLVISTKDIRMPHWLLSEAHAHGIENGLKVGVNNDLIIKSDGGESAVIFTPMDLANKEIKEMVAQSGFFYDKYPEYVGENGRRLMQILWPDKAGLFPSDKGYDYNHFPQIIMGQVGDGH